MFPALLRIYLFPVIFAAAAAEADPVSDMDGWISAAVSAFFASEDDDAVSPRAVSWSSQDKDKYDPWVAKTKFPKSVSGA